MSSKQIMRSVTYLLLVCVMLFVLCEVFELPDTSPEAKNLYSFKQLEKGIVDIVLVGTSGIDRYWIAPQAFEEFGLSSYPVTADAMPAFLYVNVLDELLTYQSPDLLLLDTRPFTQDLGSKAADVAGRRVMDCINFSFLNQCKAAITMSKLQHELVPSKPIIDLSYFFSFIKYHSIWADDSFGFTDYWNRVGNDYGGFRLFSPSHTAVPLELQTYPATLIADLNPISEKALYDVLAYIEEKHLNVLFISTPQSRHEMEEAYTNRVHQILDGANVPYISYYINNQRTSSSKNEKILQFDLSADFYNDGHTNFFGAQKFTRYLCEDLIQMYALPDHRGETEYEELWNGIYDDLKQQIENRLNQKS